MIPGRASSGQGSGGEESWDDIDPARLPGSLSCGRFAWRRDVIDCGPRGPKITNRALSRE